MKRITKLIVATLVACLMSGAAVASAQADDFNLNMTDVVLDLGTLKEVRAVDSTLDPPDPAVTFAGTITGSDIAVPKENFVFPPKQVEVQAGINATINMSANEDITGTYDSSTGDMELVVSLRADVSIPSFGANCTISPINLTASTTNAIPYLGVPFASGTTGEGALTANWNSLPAVTGGGLCGVVAGLIQGKGGIWLSQNIQDPQICDDQPAHPGCGGIAPSIAPSITTKPDTTTKETTANFAFGPGEGEAATIDGYLCTLDTGQTEPCDEGTESYTGLSVGRHTFRVSAGNAIGTGPEATYTWTIEDEVVVCPPGTTGTPPDCVEKVCPPGTTGTPPNCKKPKKGKLGALKVSPKVKAVKRGKKATFKAKVKNIGKGQAKKVKVCVTAPKKFIKVKKCVSVGNIAAGKTKTAKFKVTVKKKAKKGKKLALKFKASSNGAGTKSGKAKIKVA